MSRCYCLVSLSTTLFQASQLPWYSLKLHYLAKPLIDYVTACSVSFIVLLVVGAGVYMCQHGYFWDITTIMLNYLILPIYLTKGGRLRPMLRCFVPLWSILVSVVLAIMFLDERILSCVGVMGHPWALLSSVELFHKAQHLYENLQT